VQIFRELLCTIVSLGLPSTKQIHMMLVVCGFMTDKHVLGHSLQKVDKAVTLCCSFSAPLLLPESESQGAKVASHHHIIRSSWNCAE